MAVRSTRPEVDGDGRFVLTASHVCGSLSPAGPGEHSVLFFAAGPSQGLGRPLGQVVRSVPIAPQADIDIDATIIRPVDGLELDARIGRGRSPAGVRDLRDEALDDYVRVHKAGRMTGRTTGFLDPAMVKLPTKNGCLYGNGWWVEAEEGGFAEVGDSGSVVVDDEGYVVGMAVAINDPDPGEPKLTLCQAIVPVLDELGVEIA